jgi:hypothetical protein
MDSATMTKTPTAILSQLVAFCPDFKAYWNQTENLARESDGSFTLAGLFIEFSHFIEDNFQRIPELTRQKLFDFIEACVTEPNFDSPDELDSAVTTHFLENLAGSVPIAAKVHHYMGPKSRTIFDFWN